MNISLNNFLAFQDFSMSMSYPKRIVKSYIQDEFLSGHPNFRYKKIIILMGTNAVGKTSLGMMINHIFNFINRKITDDLISAINDKSRDAHFSIDFILPDNLQCLHRIEAIFKPDERTEEISITALHKKVNIKKNDSYERASARFSDIESEFDDYINVLRDIPKFGFFFSYPMDVFPNTFPKEYNENYKFILECVLRVLDNSIVKVEKVQEAKNSYNIHMLDGRNVLIQEGQTVETAPLSSGTKAGIAIADIITAIREKRNGFYYCDERFSYIHSDIERAILAIMSELLGQNEQLFFTTHNSDILKMPFPKHSFVFLKKVIESGKTYISCVNASDFLKRNTDSLRQSVENDLFSTAPDTGLLFQVKNI